MKCIVCSTEWPLERVSFGSVCEGCGCWLHSCVQCALWNASAQSCRSSTTDPVADREGKNFCEEWIPHEGEGGKAKRTGPSDFNKLFGG